MIGWYLLVENNLLIDGSLSIWRVMKQKNSMVLGGQTFEMATLMNLVHNMWMPKYDPNSHSLVAF